MKFRLEKETEWRNSKSVTQYYIWADGRCVEIAYSEEEALKQYENVKANYVAPNKQILKEEEI